MLLLQVQHYPHQQRTLLPIAKDSAEKEWPASFAISLVVAAAAVFVISVFPTHMQCNGVSYFYFFFPTWPKVFFICCFALSVTCFNFWLVFPFFAFLFSYFHSETFSFTLISKKCPRGKWKWIRKSRKNTNVIQKYYKNFHIHFAILLQKFIYFLRYARDNGANANVAASVATSSGSQATI